MVSHLLPVGHDPPVSIMLHSAKPIARPNRSKNYDDQNRHDSPSAQSFKEFF